MKLFLALVILTTSGLTTLTAPVVSAQDQEKQSDAFVLKNNLKRAKNPSGLNFTVTLKDKQKQFRQGEVIRLELSFSSSLPKDYILDSAGVSRPATWPTRRV